MGNLLLILIFFVTTLPMGSKSSSESYSTTLMDNRGPLVLEAAQLSSFPHGGIEIGASQQICDRPFGECILHDDDDVVTIIGGSDDIMRRSLANRGRYISYDALKKNNAPCNRRGNSYYGCGNRGKANPYNRGCSAITHCARQTN